jgi:heme/copper-type cytochrome/quinol oxidase subunit 2
MWKLWRIGKMLNIRKMWIFRKMESLRSLRNIQIYNSVLIQNMKKRMVSVKKFPFFIIKRMLVMTVIGISVFPLFFYCIMKYIERANSVKLKEEIIGLWPKQTCII